MSKPNYTEAIAQYRPQNPQEAALLTREVAVAHITVSGWVMNKALDRALLAHHNQYNKWAWPGGHADGDADLLAVAQKEVWEETGVQHVTVPSGDILSLDALPVYGHMKNGRYVSSHLHLNVTYLLLCGEDEALHHREGENNAVAWFDTGYFTKEHFDPADTTLYNKLIGRARQMTT